MALLVVDGSNAAGNIANASLADSVMVLDNSPITGFDGVDDDLSGGSGDDTLLGLGGDDTLAGNGGDDEIDGGAGANDHARFSGNIWDYVVEQLGANEARVIDGRDGSPDGTDIVRNVEFFEFANGTFAFQFAVSAIVEPPMPDDILVGNGSANALDGFAGNDQIFGNGGDDILRGGTGEDKMNGGAGNDDMSGGDGRDTMWGYLGDDRMDGGFSDDRMFGEAGDDVMFGGADDDRMDGGAGRDVIFGDDGNDFIIGDAGDDRMIGGAGNDILTGGMGCDRMVGSAGADRFDFNMLSESRVGASRDVVYFERADGDRIDLSTIDANAAARGNQAFAFIGTHAFTGLDGQLRFSGAILQGDVNGDGVADFEIRVVGALARGDIIL